MRTLILFAALAAACAAPRPFPLRPPLERDTDLDAMSVPCRVEKGARVCRPAAYESSFAWDGADNILFRPLVRFFAVDPGGEAVNVNSYDEVPDSSWFTNRIGRREMGLDELRAGPCDGPIDVDAPAGSWLVDQGKMNGANPGFRVKLPDGRRFMLKADIAAEPERATGATAIATRLYHAAGWWSACDTVVYVPASIFRLAPGLIVTDNLGRTHPLDAAHLEELLKDSSRRGDRIRFAASRWLPGRTLGPFTYAGVAADEPGDVIPHEDRRDLRGARLMAAWLNHFDSREQNSMRVWLADNPRDADSSPGRVIHYYLDLGDCFGSDWGDPAMTTRLGFAYYLDLGYLVSDLGTFGLIERPWERARRSADGSIFGYFHARDFDPEGWRGGYPNPAFDRMTERDGAWFARILARFSDAHVAAAVAVGDYTDPRHGAFLTAQLVARRDAILRRYFARLSPIADLRVAGDELCGVDLARRTRVFPELLFRYRASNGQAVRAGAGGEVCVPLVHGARYQIVDVANGQARGPLRAHVYDLGAAGFALAGIERPEGRS
jgi:hypothetical protein